MRKIPTLVVPEPFLEWSTGELEAQAVARLAQQKARLAERFRTRTRDEWCARLEGSDACFAPVLSMEEAPHHPHNTARQVFTEIDGVTQPVAAPRFSRTTPGQPTAPEAANAAERHAILREWGVE